MAAATEADGTPDKFQKRVDELFYPNVSLGTCDGMPDQAADPPDQSASDEEDEGGEEKLHPKGDQIRAVSFEKAKKVVCFFGNLNRSLLYER